MDELSDGLDSVADASGWDVVLALVIFVVGLVVAWLIAAAVRWLLRRFTGIRDGYIALAARSAQFLVAVVAAGVSLSMLDAGTGWTAVLVILVLALIAVAAHPLLTNLTSSVNLPYLVGDQVEVDGYRGTVVDITARLTVLQTLDGEIVYLRHMDVVAAPVVVFTQLSYRRSSLELTVAGRATFRDVSALLVETTSAVALVLSDPAPYVVAKNLEPEATTLILKWYHEPQLETEEKVHGEVVAAVETVLEENGLSICWPRLVIYDAASTDDMAAGAPGRPHGG